MVYSQWTVSSIPIFISFYFCFNFGFFADTTMAVFEVRLSGIWKSSATPPVGDELETCRSPRKPAERPL
ncbi:hypothetical protein BDV40DRAFT_277743 [Aspergillus tamarii]|uniref:Uncharacterized protein n=1 Tax=Aspergillus tamarii TaxID=41984 RepID=A0A5N6UG97_ASPTM|nr:hypothetical protein BDV40DRAFT_277743 [Aspergillus tamarii]